MIRFAASEPHYADHLRPVLDALGTRASFHPDPATVPAGQIAVVASWKDYARLPRRSGPVVFFEHGAGFTYQGRHHAYAGGPGRDRVALFVNVNAAVDAANRAAYPDARHVIAGSPRVDELRRIARPAGDPPTVAFAWHWDCRVNPETRSAFAHYRPHLPRVAADAGWVPLGHGHPRTFDQLAGHYRRWGWDHTGDFAAVAATATVLVCDTSSVIYEWAALDRPVVVVNAPWYRRDVDHGLRFWRDIPGPQVDDPAELRAAIDTAIADDRWQTRRRSIAAAVYPNAGRAARIAADAILTLA